MDEDVKHVPKTLYLYFQRKLIEAANCIYAKRGFSSDEERVEEINKLKTEGKLVTEVLFHDAKRMLNEWYNIPYKYAAPIFREMELLGLVRLEGKQVNRKIVFVNLHKNKLLDNTSKLYHSLGIF